MNKKVIYTSVFGDNYFLHDPEVKLEGFDFICFTDNPYYKSDIWDIKLTTKIYDGVRDSKKPKILPHRYLKDYDISIWVDGDIKITSDITTLIYDHLKTSNHAAFNHELCGMSTGNLNRRNCVYDEAAFIKWLGDNHPQKHYKDNLNVINDQIKRYKLDNYPIHNGLTRNTILIRKHNEPDVIKTMEDWWVEVKYGSKRDQLSFNYTAWKNNFEFTHIEYDIDSNPWFKLMKKWRQQQNKLIKTPEFQPISLEYFLNMELADGGGGKEIIKQEGSLKTIKDIINYFSSPSNLEYVQSQLKPENWQYFNCMLAGFRHGVADHHTLGWANMTKDYYNSLNPMSESEIKSFLKDNPVEFDNGYIRHNYHRACAMIGRLIKGESYIPFYMDTKQIYSEPRKRDKKHRIKPLTNKIKLLEKMDEMGVDRNDYCLTQSSILSIMGIRDNDDLDIIISSKLRNQNIQFPPGIDVFDANRGKFNYFGAKGDDDLLKNYCIIIDGYKFLEPRFYFARKNSSNTERDINDGNLIQTFFNNYNHKGYPFNFEEYKWGVNYVNKIQLQDINKNNFKTIIDKYNRTVDGINHGRSVYYDQNNKQYIKIFHPEYCRLNNFKESINSGFLNGLCPALTDLIYDKDNLIGYICEEGSHPQEIPQDFLITILRNCKKRDKIYYDIVPQNIIKLSNGQYSLIDLESVYNLKDLDLLPQHNAQIKPSNLLELINKV